MNEHSLTIYFNSQYQWFPLGHIFPYKAIPTRLSSWNWTCEKLWPYCRHFLSPCPNLTLAKPSHLTEHTAWTTPALGCGGKGLAQRKCCPSPKNTSPLVFVGKSRCTETAKKSTRTSLWILWSKMFSFWKIKPNHSNKIRLLKQLMKKRFYAILQLALDVSEISNPLTTFILFEKIVPNLNRRTRARALKRKDL